MYPACRLPSLSSSDCCLLSLSLPGEQKRRSNRKTKSAPCEHERREGIIIMSFDFVLLNNFIFLVINLYTMDKCFKNYSQFFCLSVRHSTMKTHF